MQMARKIKAGCNVIGSILANKLYGKRTPLIATLLVTNRCNLKCNYCYARVFDRKIEDMPIQEIFKIIDDLKALGTVLMVLSGGEPLLRDDLPDIIRHAKKNGLLCEVLTNGALVAEKAEDLKNIDYLCISLDGNETDHDKSRRKGSYKAAVSAIETALDMGIQTRIHATLTKNNVRSLPHLAELAKTYGVRLNCAIASRHTQDPSLLFSKEEIRDFYIRLKEYSRKKYPIVNALSTLDYLINWPLSYDYIYKEGDQLPPFKLVACKRKDFTCYIDVDGSLYPCSTMWNASCGNVRSDGLKTAWQKVLGLKCRSCITEVEANLLFNGNAKSFMNIFAYTVLDRLKPALIKKSIKK